MDYSALTPKELIELLQERDALLDMMDECKAHAQYENDCLQMALEQAAEERDHARQRCAALHQQLAAQKQMMEAAVTRALHRIVGNVNKWKL